MVDAQDCFFSHSTHFRCNLKNIIQVPGLNIFLFFLNRGIPENVLNQFSSHITNTENAHMMGQTGGTEVSK